jgi:hypothetical protein
MGEEKRFTHGATDVEKIVRKLQRPPDEREGVDDRARPEDKDDEQALDDVGPKVDSRSRQNNARIVGQKEKRDALDNAGQRQFDVHHHGVQLAPGC